MRTQLPKKSKVFDELNFIIRYEEGTIDDDEVIEGFQHLIDNGHAWQLQGHYGRTAMQLIKLGLCHVKGEN